MREVLFIRLPLNLFLSDLRSPLYKVYRFLDTSQDTGEELPWTLFIIIWVKCLIHPLTPSPSYFQRSVSRSLNPTRGSGLKSDILIKKGNILSPSISCDRRDFYRSGFKVVVSIGLVNETKTFIDT